jgi:hypothetical protein
VPVVVLEWGAMDFLSNTKTGMAIRDGGVVATVKLPPVWDTIVLMAHELRHVIELTRGLDLIAEAGRRGSGVWKNWRTPTSPDALPNDSSPLA